MHALQYLLHCVATGRALIMHTQAFSTECTQPLRRVGHEFLDAYVQVSLFLHKGSCRRKADCVKTGQKATLRQNR